MVRNTHWYTNSLSWCGQHRLPEVAGGRGEELVDNVIGAILEKTALDIHHVSYLTGKLFFFLD